MTCLFPLFAFHFLSNFASFFVAADYCIKHQCQNNATCVNSDMSYTCACNSSGWTGNYCEKGNMSFISMSLCYVTFNRGSFYLCASRQMSTNVKKAFMVAIAMPHVTTLKDPTIVPASQDFMETGKTAAKVSQQYFTFRTLQFKLLK